MTSMRNTGSDPVEALSARVLKDALFRYFYKNKLPSTKQFPLDSLFATERRTSSVLHGLATSLGTGLWQKLAEQIAGNFGGFSVVKPPLLEQPVDLQEADKIIQPWLAKRNAKGVLNGPSKVRLFRSTRVVVVGSMKNSCGGMRTDAFSGARRTSSRRTLRFRTTHIRKTGFLRRLAASTPSPNVTF